MSYTYGDVNFGLRRGDLPCRQGVRVTVYSPPVAPGLNIIYERVSGVVTFASTLGVTVKGVLEKKGTYSGEWFIDEAEAFVPWSRVARIVYEVTQAYLDLQAEAVRAKKSAQDHQPHKPPLDPTPSDETHPVGGS